jgi:hypothetical protein
MVRVRVRGSLQLDLEHPTLVLVQVLLKEKKKTKNKKSKSGLECSDSRTSNIRGSWLAEILGKFSYSPLGELLNEGNRLCSFVEQDTRGERGSVELHELLGKNLRNCSFQLRAFFSKPHKDLSLSVKNVGVVGVQHVISQELSITLLQIKLAILDVGAE